LQAVKPQGEKSHPPIALGYYARSPDVGQRAAVP
jgi:hypothetical protein